LTAWKGAAFRKGYQKGGGVGWNIAEEKGGKGGRRTFLGEDGGLDLRGETRLSVPKEGDHVGIHTKIRPGEGGRGGQGRLRRITAEQMQGKREEKKSFSS